MRLIDTKVDYSLEVAPNYFKTAFIVDNFSSKPGQFLNILCENVFLRRPISIHRSFPGKIEILYKKIGPGTSYLSNLKNGDIVNILGPCGNGFEIREGEAIIVGGGIGIAPLFELALKCKPCKVLIGAETKNCLLCVDDFKSLGIEPVVSTDDGSKGYKGKITDILEDLLSTSYFSLPTIYACGPSSMLDKVIKIAKEKGISAQISVEGMIGCGVGACLGCAYKTKNGYKRICKDGPVFDVEKL